MPNEGNTPSIQESSTNVNAGTRETIASAARRLSGQWKAAHWAIRVAVVTGALATLLALLPPDVIPLFVVFGFPVLVGSVIALARPHPVTAWIDRTLTVYAARRDKAAAKGTLPSRWFFRPLYAVLHSSAGWMRGIQDPYLRSGMTIAIQIYWLYAALFVAYIAIGVVIAIAMLLLTLWIMSKVLSQDWSARPSRTASPDRFRSSRAFGAARSREREGTWGNKYVEHLDERGDVVATTSEKESFFGNKYQETVSKDGERIGRSEEREGFWGSKYTQHYDGDGEKSGRSEAREGFLGNEYVQHYDQDGNKAGTSEARDGFLGQKYVEHKGE